jgi:hypothetical protein
MVLLHGFPEFWGCCHGAGGRRWRRRRVVRRRWVAVGLVALGAVVIGVLAVGAVAIWLFAAGAVAIRLTAVGAVRFGLLVGLRPPDGIAPSGTYMPGMGAQVAGDGWPVPGWWRWHRTVARI